MCFYNPQRCLSAGPWSSSEYLVGQAALRCSHLLPLCSAASSFACWPTLRNPVRLHRSHWFPSSVETSKLMARGRQSIQRGSLNYSNIAFEGLESFLDISIKKFLSVIKILKFLFQSLQALEYSNVSFWRISGINEIVCWEQWTFSWMWKLLWIFRLQKYMKT